MSSMMRVTRLDEREWQARQEAHHARVDAWIEPHLERRRRAQAHPVEDFLFSYYGYRPSRLRRWHPGAFTVLEGAADFGTGYVSVPGGQTLDVADLVARRLDSITWIADLLRRTASRAGQFGCFGMHEWAMVYRTDEVRHSAQPLRLSPQRVAAAVEERPLKCTHFDAYRFFTEPARPLNTLPLSRELQPATEQPGCLHANMDLYKWAVKLSPLVPGELVADCFELAWDIRAVDMRASPYDLRHLGYEPIPIETAEGRTAYAATQREFAGRAAPLRAELIAWCDRLLT
ncbi:3-methyladenine DNA glycosylase [Herbidospora sp. NEAU-GS84]|uniref:3-methyladenine DNA glycosylase n=2 Tax=Herbidospora solisilvae TaxID=2696284 RepID=A0A7C9JYD7_9ACTN|nr:3-methyladenine DNA glycosylase [Herbidospora solisilvae]